MKNKNFACIGQLKLFEENEEQNFQIEGELREAITKIIRKSNKSRYIIAAMLSEKVGFDITKTMLDAWTADSKEYHRIPAIIIPALSYILNSLELFYILAKPLGIQIVSQDESLLVEIARIKAIKKELETREKILEERLSKVMAKQK